MTTKHEVIATHCAHPDWTTSDIARHLNCVPQYVTATAKRNGLHLPKRQRPPSAPRFRKTAHISPLAMSAFAEPARLRGIKVHELATRIIDQVAADGMIDAVLDDRVPA